MQVDWTYYGCDEHDVPALEQHWDDVRLELEGKVAQLSDNPSELRFAVEQSESNPGWEIQAALHIPGHTVVASAEGRTPERTLDAVLRVLADGIDKVQDTEVKPIKRRQGAGDVTRILSELHADGKSKAFLSFVMPFVSDLAPYVDQELRLREIEANLPGDELDTSDVLDEVLLLTWEHFSRRKPQMPLELWLVELADQVLDRLCAQLADSSIDVQSPGASDDARQLDNDDWVEHVSYPETLEIAELLPAGLGIETWDGLDLESKQTHLSELLGRLDRDQRQAFVLSVAHGFSAAEISDFQDRVIDEVESDIGAAIAAFRRRIIEEQEPDAEDQFVRADERKRQHRGK